MHVMICHEVQIASYDISSSTTIALPGWHPVHLHHPRWCSQNCPRDRHQLLPRHQLSPKTLQYFKDPNTFLICMFWFKFKMLWFRFKIYSRFESLPASSLWGQQPPLCATAPASDIAAHPPQLWPLLVPPAYTCICMCIILYHSYGKYKYSRKIYSHIFVLP